MNTKEVRCMEIGEGKDKAVEFYCGLLGPVYVLPEQKDSLVFEINGFNGGAYTLEQMEQAISLMQAAMWYAQGKYGERFLRE